MTHSHKINKFKNKDFKDFISFIIKYINLYFNLNLFLILFILGILYNFFLYNF